CDAGVTPMVLGSRSEPLDVGRTTRTIPTAIRKAVVFRDQGCSFPSCDRPARWCDVHHVEHWADGGPTELGNLTLLCRLHHTLVHHSPWRIDMDDGIPTFVPPTYIDRQQRPRTNLIHRRN
ncbi:MAG TPA: HNH endonuclease signature motif containing protein, partial [Pseudonocardiaceae bacterium]|nr:HNH endonuclease signature motif containing protein [Pseudonocardiaceae bacterium]